MVQILKKYLLEFPKGFLDKEKILTIAKEDNRDMERLVYYISKIRGKKQINKLRINIKERARLEALAITKTPL